MSWQPINRDGERCPCCGEGELSSVTSREQVTHGGHSGEITVHYSVCSFCGSEVVGKEEGEANKSAMEVFKNKRHGAWNSSTGGTRKELEKAVEELRRKVEREAAIWEKRPALNRTGEAIEVLISHGYEEEAEILRNSQERDR